MSAVSQILVSGLTLGAMYAVATLGLSLMWGALRMLNMAHGALLTLGGYLAYTASAWLGLPAPVAFLVAAGVGAFAGWLIYRFVVHPMLDNPSFETNVIIATVGLGLIIENGILQIYGGQPLGQPVAVAGLTTVFGITFQSQNGIVFLTAVGLIVLVHVLLRRTRFGAAVRASVQQREGALVVGVPVNRVFAQILALSGALVAVSGVMLTSIAQLSPTVGTDPMLKAFIMCVLAGLGNVAGSLVAAFALALLEVSIQFAFGARWGFPALLLIVVLILIWRPYGIFSRTSISRQ